MFKFYSLFYFLIFSIFSCATMFANPFDSIDSKLTNGELESAQIELDRLQKRVSLHTYEEKHRFLDYKCILGGLYLIESFNQQIEIYNKSQKTSSDILSLRSAYYDSKNAWTSVPKQLRVSKDLIQCLNEKISSVSMNYSSCEESFRNEEAKRKMAEKLARQTELEQKKADEQKRVEREAEQKGLEKKTIENERKRQLRQIEAENKRAEQEREAKEKTHQEKTEAIHNAVTKLGYKGLNTQHGIARFLYNAQHVKDFSLETGLNEVFWTKISEHDKMGLDDRIFRLSQIADGWEIYTVNNRLGDRFISLSIAVKSDPNSLPIEGQRLKNELYVFKGNLQFKTSDGAVRIIQQFDPVHVNY